MKKQLGLALAAGLATSAVLVGTGGTANAATTIGSVGFATSNNTANATANDVWTFAVGGGAAVTDPVITLDLPHGTGDAMAAVSPAASATLATSYGLTGCTTKNLSTITSGTNGTDDDTITLTATGTSCSIADGASVSIEIDGLVNPAVATSFTATVGISGVTASATPSSDISPDQTAVNVIVPESLTFTNNTTTISLMPIPGGGPVTASPVGLVVKTNAAGGYSLNACMKNVLQTTADANEIPAAGTTGGVVGTSAVTLDSATHFGFGGNATVDQNGSGGTLTYGGGWHSSGTTVVGYQQDCSSTDTNALVVTDNKPASNDQITLSNSVSVPGDQAYGTYGGTINYVVTPHIS